MKRERRVIRPNTEGARLLAFVSLLRHALNSHLRQISGLMLHKPPTNMPLLGAARTNCQQIIQLCSFVFIGITYDQSLINQFLHPKPIYLYKKRLGERLKCSLCNKMCQIAICTRHRLGQLKTSIGTWCLCRIVFAEYKDRTKYKHTLMREWLIVFTPLQEVVVPL